MDRLIEWLPHNIPPRRRDGDRPRRLPPRQPDLPSDRAARARRARLGALDARPSAGRLHVPLMAWRLSGDEFRGMRGGDLRRARHSDRDASTCALSASAGRDRRDPTRARLELLHGVQHVPARGHPAGLWRARWPATRRARARVEAGRRARPLAERGWSGSRSDARRRLATTNDGATHGLRTGTEGARAAGAAVGVHGRSTSTRTRSATTRSRTRAPDRWQPARVVEELKPRAQAAGLWNLFLPASDARRGPHEPRVRAAGRDHGPRPVRARGLQLLGARHRQHGGAGALRHARAEAAVAGAAARRQRSARPSR